MWDHEELLDRLATVETLLTDLAEENPRATEAVRALVDVYGEALARIVHLAEAGGEDGAGGGRVTEALAGDELVARLLLVHDLHPHEPGVRIRAALEKLAPRVRAELTGLDAGVATVRVTAGAVDLVPDAVRDAAPEVTDVRVEQRQAARTERASRPEQAFVPLTAVRAR